MKKLIGVATLLCALATNADLTTVKITDFTGSYKKPDGRATATQLVIPTSEKSKIEITVEGIENGYLLKYGENEFEFKNPPKMINNIHSGNWKGVNFVTQGNTLNAKIDSLYSIVEDSDTNLSGFSAKCNEAREFESYGHQLLDACLTNSTFTINYLKTESSRKVLNILEDIPGARASTTIVKNGSININSNSFKINAKIDIGMSAKVKIEGTSEFQVDKNRVAIRIDKAKASFMNIRNKIFTELKKSENETLKVQKPYIYLLLK
jgi:hypothetical protein